MRAVLVSQWDHDTDRELDLGMYDRGTLRAVSALRHVRDYLAPRRSSQVGIFGTSVGGILSALVLGYDPRISIGAFVVAGGGMSEIISASMEENLRRLRAARLASFQYESISAYRQALVQAVKIDPLDFVDYSGHKKVLMVIATEDITVPTANQLRLADAYRDAEVIQVKSDHLGTVIRSFAFEQEKILRFFEANLN